MIFRKQFGFTLLELMVAVAILAIISAVAYPLYKAQNRKGNRPLAMTMLEKIAQAEQRHFTEKGVYITAWETLPEFIDPKKSGASFTNGRYSITVAVPDIDGDPKTIEVDGNAFVITAEVAGVQADDTCKNFTLDSAGRRDGDPNRHECWGKTKTAP